MAKKLIVLLHIFVILAFFSNPANWTKPSFTKVALHVIPHAKASSVVSEKKQIQSKPNPSPPSKKQAPIKKNAIKPSPRKPVETKKIQKTSPPQKKEASQEEINKETIAKILEKIDKLEKKTNDDYIAATSTSSQPIAAQNVEDAKEISDVIQYLFEILELPGPGQVTVEMFLNQDGKVDNIAILESENPENSQYLILKLKDIVLPFHKKGLVPSSMKVCFSNLKA